MEIRVLGPFEMVTDDGQLLDVGGHLPQALLVTFVGNDTGGATPRHPGG